MKLTRTEEVAILIAAELSTNPDRQVSLSEIEHKHGVPLPFLKKIARMLKSAGIVKSREGASGGYVLSQKTGLSVGEVISAVTDPFMEKMEGNVASICPLRPSCLPQAVRVNVGKAIIDAMESVKIAALSAGKGSLL